MALEAQSCCGALTHTYVDAGHRRHNPGCRYATEGSDAPQRGGEPLPCCGAPTVVSAQTGRPLHYDLCMFAEDETGTIRRPVAAVEPDPAESRMMHVAVEIIVERGLWAAFCAETGTNEWARNEGQVRDGELLPLSEAQAVRVGLLPAPKVPSW